MYVWWYYTEPMGEAAPIVMDNMVTPWIGEVNSFFWAAPVSRLLERLTDVPLKLKKRNNVHEIEVGVLTSYQVLPGMYELKNSEMKD